MVKKKYFSSHLPPQPEKEHENEEKYTATSFITCTFHQILGDHLKEDEIGRACIAYGVE